MLTADDPSLRDKTGDAEVVFMRLCEKFGAERVEPGAEIATRLMIVQQFPYSDENAALITGRVTAKRRVGLMALALAGLEQHDRFLAQFSIEKVYVPSARFMHFLLERRGAVERYSGLDIEQVGLPYGAYPVFGDFHADWLIAAPTLFSFSSEKGKQAFLDAVLRLLAQVPAGDVVAYKPHNGNRRDYFVPRLHYALSALFTSVPGGERLLRWVARAAPHPIRRPFSRMLTSLLHRDVLKRAVPMQDLTPYADISLEAFLPGVRKGVIGGLSNTIWGTLYFKLPFFNCVDPADVHHGESELLNKSSESLLKLNLQYFAVPYCGGELARGSYGDHVFGADDRSGDLLQSIKLDLAAVS